MPRARGIQRHRLDTFALTIGLLSVALAGLSLASRADVLEVDGLVALATVWLVLGAVGVTKVVHRLVVGSEARGEEQPG